MNRSRIQKELYFRRPFLASVPPMLPLNQICTGALAFLLLVSACGGSDEPEECETYSLCSCDVKKTEGFCIDFDSESDFREEACRDLGGTVEQQNCSTTDLVGVCEQVDDCHDPEYFFYDNYTGALPGAETVDDLPEACDEGEFVTLSCAWWTTEYTF